MTTSATSEILRLESNARANLSCHVASDGQDKMSQLRQDDEQSSHGPASTQLQAMPFVKLDSTILSSTVWTHDSDIRIVWITMLAMCDKDGIVNAKAPGISTMARVPLEKVRQAIDIFLSPDEDSRTETEDGKRIKKVENGYEIINYARYRDKDHSAASRMQRYRERKKNDGALRVTLRNGDVTTRNVTQAYIDVNNSLSLTEVVDSTSEPVDKPDERCFLERLKSKNVANITPKLVATIAEHNVPTDTLDAAIEVSAAKRKEPGPPPLAYIVKVLESWNWHDPPNGTVKPWHESASGIEVKGFELGLRPADFRSWPDFRAAVYLRAGISS